MSEIADLVSRLRSLTGYVVSAPAPPPAPLVAAPVEKQLSADSLLVLQQSLRRHPCFGVFGLSRAEVDCQVLRQVEDAARAAPMPAEGAPEAVAWRVFANEAAERLEAERLRGVFVDAAGRVQAAREELFRRLGVEAAPQLEQVGDGYACPWNVAALLECGVLFDQDDFREWARAVLEVPNATASIAHNLRRVHADTYDTMTWLYLLHQMMSFPVSSVRAVWHAALYHFPTAAPLVCVYVRLELVALAKKARLEKCRGEADAKDVYSDCLRLLNIFYRHLPLAFSCELYSLFFSFATEYIQPDNDSLDLLYRTCLRRDVGMLPQSTPLWVQYLNWRSATVRDHMRRREWRKRMYNRVLAIPLVGLDAVKDEYDLFVATEYRGRVAPDEKIELEKRLVRVKTEADDLSRLMYFIYPTEWEPASSTQVTFPHTLYLARPLSVDGPTSSLSLRESVLSRIELDLWGLWCTLLQRIRRPLFPGTGGEALHYGRCRSAMTMMACFFPHQPTLWMELVDFCVHQQPLLSEKERFQSVAAAIDMAVAFSRRDVCVRLFVAQVYSTDLSTTELAFREIKSCLLHLRAWLLHFVRTETEGAGTPEEVLERLQHIAVLAVNYMRMGNGQGEAEHVRLVARFVMHQVDFLSLTTAALRKLLKAGAVPAPAPFLRPFHVFCASWITLELIRNRAAGRALLVLQQWCEHLKMMLRSGKSKAWSCEECGVDELVLDACANLLTADPACRDAVDAALTQLEEVAGDGDLCADRFLYLARQLRHRFFLPPRPPPSGDVSDVLLRAKLLLPHAAPQRYDTDFFQCPAPPQYSPLPPAPSHACPDPREVDTAAAAFAEPRAAAQTSTEDDAANAATPPPQHTFPEETLWAASGALRTMSASGRPRFERPRRPPVPGRFHDSGDAAAPELPTTPAVPPSRLAVVSEAVQLPTLLDCLAAARPATGDTADGGRAATKLPPLDLLEELITSLPSVYEYSPDIEESGIDVSTDWVLNALRHCEALS